MLVQLIYTSTATRNLSEAELGEILSVAVRNNEKCNVTGLLLYSQGTFMQALEGEESVVDDLFKIIQADERHCNVEEQVRTPICTREFSQWFMGYRALRDSDALALPNYAPFFEDGFDVASISSAPGECLYLMKALSGLPS